MFYNNDTWTKVDSDESDGTDLDLRMACFVILGSTCQHSRMLYNVVLTQFKNVLIISRHFQRSLILTGKAPVRPS
jgi:hypothetical protein